MEAGAAQCEKGESEMKAITEKELEGKVTDEDMKVVDSQEIVAAQEILSKGSLQYSHSTVHSLFENPPIKTGYHVWVVCFV